MARVSGNITQLGVSGSMTQKGVTGAMTQGGYAFPAAPSGLALTITSSSEIDLAWTDNATNEDGFSIERSLDGITYVEIDTVAANVVAYEDTGLTASTLYYYRVRAYRGSYTYSSYSNVDSDTTDSAYATYLTYIEIQPNALLGKDTTIYNSAPTKNRGANVSIAAGEINVGAIIFRGLIQFDLSSLPDNAIITSCKLNFHVTANYADTAREFKVYRMKKEWTEGTGTDTVTGDGATWNTYDGSNAWQTVGAFGADDCEQTSIGVSYQKISPTVLTAVEFTLTPTSKADLDLGYGWLIKAETESEDAHAFMSSDYTVSAARRPSLFISYLLPTQANNFLFPKNAYNPMISGGFFGSVIYIAANDYLLYYSDGTNVLRAASSDRLIWTPDTVNNPILTPDAGTLDVASAWKEDSSWYMLYRSNEWGGDKSIGLATSADGITWTKEATNPVITNADLGAWATGSIDPWGVIKIGATYYLWVNDVGEDPRETGLVTSTDLINWTEDANSPMFTNGRYCVDVIKYNGYYYLFVPYTPNGSYDVGAINHRIELYKDTDPRFLPASRKYLGYITVGGGLGSWDNLYLDTPTVLTKTIQRDTYPDDELFMYYSGYDGASGVAAMTTWNHGLAIGDFNQLKNMPSKTEPGAGE